MKFTLASLKEFLETNASLNEICEKLTAIGLEVESVIDQGAILNQFSVAKIVSCQNHPNSSKLKICQVEVADNSIPLQIVCGASNARQGIKVAYAKIDSVIPASKMIIKKAKIAGIESNGMLCSAQELELGNDSQGIIEIDDRFNIGCKISEVFNKNDAVIEIYVTPNRADCLGLYGIARDLSACGLGKLKKLSTSKIAGDFEINFSVDNEDINACNYVIFRQIKNIKNCQSPQWLKDKIEAVGFNSISAIVDITNYVMHLTSQPMHAYDSQKINQKITIGYADNFKDFTSLQNQSYKIDEDILTIKDQEKILAIAGIIGSSSSSCNDNTCDIVLESASFNSNHITKSGRKLNILSESRHRFERTSDPHNCELAIDLATNLILEICSDKNAQISHKKIIGELPKNRQIKFNYDKFEKLIGFTIDENKAKEILFNLGFDCDDNFNLSIPSYRSDINIDEDIIEEIIRIYGYDHIKAKPITNISDYKPTITNHKNKSQNIETKNHQHFQIKYNNSYFLNYYSQKINNCLINRAMNETINWSFVDNNISKLFDDNKSELFLENPVSSEMNYLRPTLAIGLINSYQKNALRSNTNLSLFEIGNIFINLNHQQLSIAGLRAGKNCEANHHQANRDFDVFDVKADLLACLETINLKTSNLEFTQNNIPPYYHPHRSASILIGKNILGYCGEIHPALNQKFAIKNRLNLFEIFLDEQIINKKPSTFKAYIANDFPVVDRDFAFIVDKNLPVNDLIKTITNIDKNLIKKVNIFDIFSGKNIEQNKKSVALNVKIQADDRTLTTIEIDELSTKIITQVNTKFNACLRN
ncbi:MAG: phenylalanine--tRNA ligase subunit beta [Alphaproteobacteria bacterium]